ncbi:hypothetical protein HMP0721_0116 [Pseudoramibacter alactolyticus ATCC 23263]|uniref:Uncharacterized protein n=1 Tax=Pseudoramibacter alactolyticus ATCC 23263 TaxID=887929 RepID=E6MDN4_9FIRM|nr:hypothetical protein HMP0721_0116 [Pseudoramibacter alactolyticus ATCC 23263]
MVSPYIKQHRSSSRKPGHNPSKRSKSSPHRHIKKAPPKRHLDDFILFAFSRSEP